MIFNVKKENQGGFTFLEVVISISILAIGVLAVAKMQTVAVRGVTLANQSMEDTVSGQDIIERVIAARYSDLSIIDLDGNGADGLNDGLDLENNDKGASADYSLDSANGNYYAALNIDTNKEIFSIYWNVQENFPNTNTKTIRFFIESDTPEGKKVQTYDFIKGKLTRP
jgi:prepilin-type N-terminal cleavage/methylation domain-containing protein